LLPLDIVALPFAPVIPELAIASKIEDVHPS
jgi:hypothetical protein